MKEISKISTQFGLGLVASNVANLRGKSAATRLIAMLGPFGPTLSLIVEEASMNNVNYTERSPCFMRALGWTRHLWEDWSKKSTIREVKRLKRATGPTVEARKTKMLVEIEGTKSGSKDSDDGIVRRNDDTSHTKALDDSKYFKGDNRSIKSPFGATNRAFSF
jgi:hypothetical protein